MSHAFKSMTYRLVHNRLVWLILVALIVIEVLTLCSGGETCFANHKTYSRHDHHSGTEITEYAVFEEEDPLLVNKLTQNIYKGKFDFLQGQINKYEVSLSNVGSVSGLLPTVLLYIFAADAVFIMVFFGEMFSDGAIRNLVTVKISKVSVYIVSLIINAAMCLIMYILVFTALAVCILLAGFYPIIYMPAFAAAVLVGLLVTVTITSFFLLILFADQNPLISFIFCTAVVALSVVSMPVSDAVFEPEFIPDEVQEQNFFKGGYRIMGEGEWYFPVDDFRIGRVYYPADNVTVEFMSETPNPYYPDKTVLALMRTCYRANIMNLPWEMQQFMIYPMYRDGLLARYAVISSGYLLLVIAGGCFIVSKRNIE